MRDAVQSMIDFESAYVDSAGKMEDLIPLGGIQLYDREGNFDLDYLPPEEWRKAKAEGLAEGLPPIRAPETVTGGGIRTISQFMRRHAR